MLSVTRRWGSANAAGSVEVPGPVCLAGGQPRGAAACGKWHGSSTGSSGNPLEVPWDPATPLLSMRPQGLQEGIGQCYLQEPRVEAAHMAVDKGFGQ